ncbi:MAG TPA: septum site-determining protein MinC [Steroidobacteraceae bacterium]|nr:septum site-determining protein MinC [Steroidobacteraceae bacterium]
MNNPAAVAHEPAFEIRFGQVGLAQMRIRSTDAEAVQAQLTARVAAAPALFERAALCLDLSPLDHDISAAELRAVFEAIRRTGMLPVGLAHGTAAIDALARELNLPVLTQFRAQKSYGAAVAAVKAVPAPEAAPAPAPAAPAAPAAAPAAPAEEIVALPTLMHHRPVRSGQKIYARHRDLVVTSAVGAGAEVMADGCVHVYGTLRGRAMAGVRGEVSARVFCHEFHAELVSIAGVFRVFETIPPDLAGKPVQAWLDGDDLRFGRIGHD